MTTKTFMIPAHGRRFKVVSEKTGALMGQYDTLEDAQAQADGLCNDTKRTHHYYVYEVVFCGGSKRLSDLDRRVEAIKNGDVTEGPAIVKFGR